MFEWLRLKPDLRFDNRVRGGVHPESHKADSAGKPIVTAMPLPPRLYLPLQQHAGRPAEPEVRVGDQVLQGQLIASSHGAVSAHIHAPTSGVVADIIDFPAPHPSALPTKTLVIEPDGEERAVDRPAPPNPFTMDPREIAAQVAAAGVVGLGGAAFPSSVKLELGRKSSIHTLVINGGECEPYLTCDDRLMRERAAQIIDGIRIMLYGLQAERALVGIEDNKPEAVAAMRTAAAPFREVHVHEVPTHYPMGWDRQLIRYLTDREVPAGARATDVGVLMHNVGTAYAVHDALRFGAPLTRRIVTVAGGAVERPVNIEAPFGTLLSHLLAFCGWDEEQTARLIIGGPMMGDALPRADVPLIKGINGVLALGDAEIAATPDQPCIRCSRCVAACPVGLLPLEMAVRIKVGNLDGAVDYGLKDCISCGSCSYVCPSAIPLVHYFKYAKDDMVAQQKNKNKADEIKRLIEARKTRLERKAAGSRA